MNATKITRTFLGLEQPALPAVVDFLREKYGSQHVIDLSRLLVVVAGRGAGRRLLELLAIDADERRLMLIPPTIDTVGRVAEHLYTPRRPFATDVTQELAWTRVLLDTGGSRLEPLWPSPPPPDSIRWRELGALLRRQHRELAADGLDFADVAQQVEALGGKAEHRRWETLALLQASYHQLLDKLELWDRQTARLKAIELEECSTESEIVLVGTVDMNVALRRMLDQVAEKVTSLILAPAQWGNRFDEYGCLIPDQWRNVELGLLDEQIEVVDGPQDQAAAIVRRLASYEGRYHADDITIGVPNVQLVPEIQRQLAGAGVGARWGPGESLANSSPFLLLKSVSDFVAGQRFSDFARLVRHADVADWLAHQGLSGDWNTELDLYQARHLPYRVPQKWLGPPSRTRSLTMLSQRVNELLNGFGDSPCPLHDWRAIVSAVLTTVYDHRLLDRTIAEDRMTLRCCSRIVEVLEEQATVPEELAPMVSAEDAIRLTLEAVGRETVAAELTDAVEMLGWLELPWDDAPALVVASFNEGYVPESVNSDIFLPNTLRTKLGLLDNTRRYARDAYALQVLLQTRESLHVIVGRRTTEGDPLPPSRLLFATTPESAVQRTRRIFASVPDQQRSALPNTGRAASEDTLPIPKPEPQTSEVTELRVTSFRDYLACPYRFFLRHILQLTSISDHADELDGAAFGTLAHEVLRRFAMSDSRDSTDSAEIRDVLSRELSKHISEQFGTNVMPAVHVQVEQLKLRLAAFAVRQAAWAADGWRIEHVESESGLSVPFEVDQKRITLRGRIDRIDLHAASGRRVILDYKTSDLAKTPEQVHRHRGAWIDLQLPLYRHLATALGIEGTCELGFVVLPRDTSKVDFWLSNWSVAQLDEADEVARDVIRGMREQKYWPPTDPAPNFSGEFAAICQDHVAR